MFHPYDTQVNEGLNMCILYGAPKHKNYSTTMSLATRVSTKAAVNSVGYVNFFVEVFKLLGSVPERNIFKSWQSIDNEMSCHKKYAQNPSIKSYQVKKQNDEIKKSYQQEMADKKQGIDYKSGIGFGGYVTPPAQKGTKEKKGICKHCGLQGH